MKPQALKETAQKLRSQGYTLNEILNSLPVRISKSTISLWCKDVPLNNGAVLRIKTKQLICLQDARIKAIEAKLKTKNLLNHQLLKLNSKLLPFLARQEIKKIILAILYITEGSKGKNKSCITFGNSNPKIILLFLDLLRNTYQIEERKFRCTIQCRKDQDVQRLEQFWSNLTGIPNAQFYHARIDPRSIGKRSMKPEYKGVCRIDYLSIQIYRDIMSAADVILSKRGP